ncbi:carbohydrate ABC transporter permease [Parasphaerochaeta coccoides]|uniref:Binding-protein-dependent transport systems inner membrane component n=1 Tax=Parasphaerochaeta coccoides (strain ATCC BAA-1237 / DSM 17374 / SPN1) TaxID=760011 RepID=F4GK95_PARC1|nr:carbohydrate ABC transporter permease [Parasphaerochaeta coccoides]AEC02291.1 binding-protein-dependent transport systems inner membrane component [Parasphaerochaeta coccoides DSM 17374]
MKHHTSIQAKIFQLVNVIILCFLALACLLPFLNLLAISLSSSTAVSTGRVNFWPVGFTFDSYRFVLEKPEFYRSFYISVAKVLVGVPLNMVLSIITAYPLSKTKKEFRARTGYLWYFLATIVFSGGLIPWYLVINKLGLIDNFLALVLPVAVPVFNVVILANFFKTIPKGLEEAALIDGASHWQTMTKIFVPLSTAALASIMLFSIVNHWNSWFEGLILMNRPENYPLQSYLQTVVVNRDVRLMTTQNAAYLSSVSERTSRAAQVFIATLPVVLIYPFLQRFFTTGLISGSIKE